MKHISMSVLGAAFAVAISSVSALAQEVTLNYSSWLPLTHWINQEELNPWFADIAKVTEGRVKVEVLPKTVGTAASQFDVVSDGLADLSFIVTAYSPGRFPLAGMGSLPLLGNNPAKMALLFENMYRENFWSANEFKGVELMAIWNITPNQIWNNTREVKTLEDMKGLKLRSPNDSVTQLLTSIGAVPINKPSSEAYELLSTGAIDGQITQADTVIAQNMVPLTKYGTIIPGGITNATLAIIANPAKWEQISEKDRKAIEDITIGKVADKIGKAYQRREAEGMKTLVAAGYKITEVDAAFVEELKKHTGAIDEEWIKSAKAKGIADPAAILAKFRADAAVADKAN